MVSFIILLIPSKSTTYTRYDKAVLGGVSDVLFPGADPSCIEFEPKHGITMDDGKRAALDCLRLTRNEQFKGRNKVILENIGRNKANSKGSHQKDQPTAKNLWRRQIEQLLRKVPVALRFDAGLAVLIEDVLYAEVSSSLGAKSAYTDDWEVALISIGETSNPSGAPRLRSSFLTFEQMIHAVTKFPSPAEIIDPFNGGFFSLANPQLRFD